MDAGGLLIDVAEVVEDRAADLGGTPPAGLRRRLGHRRLDVTRDGLDPGVGLGRGRLGLAGRRLGGRLGLLGLSLGLLLGRSLGVQLGLEHGDLRLQLVHFGGEPGALSAQLGHLMPVVVMLYRRGLRNRSKPQRENRAESGPAEKRGLARHVSDPCLIIPRPTVRAELGRDYRASVTLG